MQTAATERNALRFGTVSSLARIMRLPIQQAIGDNHDRGMHKRMATPLVNSLNQNTETIMREHTLLDIDIANLMGFDLNKNIPLTKYCNLPLTFDVTDRNTVKIAMPTPDVASCFKFPVNSKQLNIEVICTRVGFELQSEANVVQYSLPIYKDTAEIEVFEWESMELKLYESLTVIVQMWCVRDDASKERQLLSL